MIPSGDVAGLPEERTIPGALSGALGLSRRAGRLLIGVDKIRRALDQGGGLLILLASDVSPVAAETLRRRTERGGSRFFDLPFTREMLGRAVGVENATALAIPIHDGFARSIQAACAGRERCP
jgi:ribosomal protein L7Ae-like RNA K-turn-binding protein